MDKELVTEWFRFADMDLDIAENSLKTMHPAPLEIICYHCQQAVEKFIKGLIIAFDNEPEKTHDLLKIIAVLKKYVDFPTELEGFAEILTLYGVRTRYPNAIFVDEDQTKIAISQANKIKQWANTILLERNESEKDTLENLSDTVT